MSAIYYLRHLAILAVILPILLVSSYKRNYDAKYTKSDIPLWKQRACEKAQAYKANSHYFCDEKGDIKCLPGWQGDLCQVPMCRMGCHPMNGYCQRPGECRCRIGYTGELCDKCIPLPGCQHGDCTKPFECICRPGWDGLFCTEPTCRQGCHNTRGYCETPGECRCRIGWAGRNCSDCSILPGCVHGTCNKPLECNCLPGFTGLLCQIPICHADCHKQHGYCKKPGECRCKVGWTGSKCDQCFPYPGCVNGDCEKPWECNCKPGWGGMLCDEKLTYCKENPNSCENDGKCVSLTKEDGNYRCLCKQGYLGKNCEIVDEYLLTSTMAPRITPPSLILEWEDEEDEQKDKEKFNEIEKMETKANETLLVNKENITETHLIKTPNAFQNVNTNSHNENETNNIIKMESKHDNIEKLILNFTAGINNTISPTLPSLQSLDIYGSDIIGTATTTMNATKAADAILKPNPDSLRTPNANVTTTPTISSSDIIGTATTLMNTTKTSAVLLKLEKVINSTSPGSNSNALAGSNIITLNTTPKTLATTPSTSPTSPTKLSSLNKLDDKNVHTIPSNSISNKVENSVDDDDEDEECTEDDNEEDCEYDEDEEDDEEDEDDSK